MVREYFGKLENGETVDKLILQNDNGIKAVILNYGGILKELWVPDRNGISTNVVLSYDTLEDYICNPAYLGAVIGRTAGRVEDGILQIDGISYELEKNNGNNTLHGGSKGFHQKLMEASFEEEENCTKLILQFESLHNEGGFPGKLKVKLIYSIIHNENLLKFEIRARSDRKTYLNMTNHSYFNLSNDPNDTIETHRLKLNSDFYAPVDDDTIPRRGWKTVDNTPFDFRESKLIGDAIHSNNSQIRKTCGIDHPFKLQKDRIDRKQVLAAQLFESKSGRLMKVYTSKPHMVIYTSNFLEEVKVKSEKTFNKYQGICFEAQEAPNALNFDEYGFNYLDLDYEYKHYIIYKFEIK